MPTRVYKLYATGTGNAVATLTIGRDGIINGVAWAYMGSTGAATTVAETCELSLNGSTTTFTTNDTPGNSIDTCGGQGNIANSGFAQTKSTVGMAIPVRPGDKLYLHQQTAAGGSAFATRAVSCHIFVTEGK